MEGTGELVREIDYGKLSKECAMDVRNYIPVVLVSGCTEEGGLSSCLVVQLGGQLINWSNHAWLPEARARMHVCRA